MRISWVIEDHGSGQAEAESVDGAADALTAAVRAAYEPEGQTVQVHVLLNVVAPVREALVTVGAAALDRGERWEQRAGGLLVAVEP